MFIREYQTSGRGSKELLGLDTWVNIARDCVSSILPSGFPASQEPTAVLDWTAANGTHLVKAVSQELAQFPGAEEALFLGLAFKKWRFSDPSSAQRRSEAAIEGFVERNARAYSLRSASPHTREQMRKLLKAWLPFQGVAPGRFGPGAVAEHCSHARRWEILSPWLEKGYKEFKGRLFRPRELDALVGPPRPRTSCPDDELFRDIGGAYSDHSTSRLCAVPKDWNKDRLITVEPVIRSYHQQAARTSILEAVHAGPLRGSAMDPYSDGQMIQRELALRASESRLLSTIDLSDASDNITAEFVYDVFPSWVVTLLEQCRSNTFTDGRKVFDLNIYAGMGNATTFLIETLLFTAYCRAVAWQNGLTSQTVSVFGDDIIVSSDLHRALLDMNDDFFRINTDKSFGPNDSLRESCGIYALNGKDVTPPRINGFADSFQGRLGLSEYVNRNMESNLPYRIRFGYGLASVVVDRKVMENWPFSVEGYPSVDFPDAPYDDLPELRMHKDYQYREARVAIPSPATYDVPPTFVWALQASLSRAICTRASDGRLIFPSRGRYKPPRKRWCRVVGS